MDAISARKSANLAWSRSVQLLVSLAVCIIIIGYYDYNKNTIVIAALKQPDTPPTPSLTVAASPSAAPYYPPLAPAPTASTLPGSAVEPPPLASNNKPTITDIYNPEDKTSGDQSRMDALKKRYESLLVTYLFLKRCKQADETDYHIITSGLSQEMASMNAPGRLQYDIVTAAQGSYKEIYSKTTCTTEGIGALKTQYDAYIQRIKQEFILP